MTDIKQIIGWIGAGKMGLPICLRFKAAGHPVHVLARTNESKVKLESAGLVAKLSIAEVCGDADIVFSSISDDAALQEVVCNAGGIADSLAKGSTYIDISTVSPAASRRVAERLQEAGIAYLRSPVSGSTVMADAGILTAVVSGPHSKLEELQAIFAQFARKSFYVGDAEEARAMKLVLNSIVAATSALLAEALAFGARGGLDLATMLNVVNQSVVASPLIAYKTDMIVSGNYKAAASLAMLKKDLDLLLETSPAPLPLSAQVHEIYQSGISRGLGEDDFFVLVREALSAGDKS